MGLVKVRNLKRGDRLAMNRATVLERPRIVGPRVTVRMRCDGGEPFELAWSDATALYPSKVEVLRGDRV